jgi:hypothetical protein
MGLAHVAEDVLDQSRTTSPSPSLSELGHEPGAKDRIKPRVTMV